MDSPGHGFYLMQAALCSNVVPCRNDYAVLDVCKPSYEQLFAPYHKDGGWRSGDYA